jgi:hypothetical protein
MSAIKSYKGFNKDMTCRGFQYEIGKEYEEKEAKACECGFHACEYPLDVFGYYNPAQSKFCEVEQDGIISTHDEDSKVASSKIKIGAEISIAGLVKAAIKFTKSKTTKENDATGYKGASSATGYKGASSATGTCGASSATGDCGASSATGYKGASSAGNSTAVAVAWGYESKAKGVKSSHIVCAEWKYNKINNEWDFIQAKMAQVDGVKIKEDTYYQLIDGEFVEVTD